MTLSTFLINIGINIEELSANQIQVARELMTPELSLSAKKVTKLAIEASRIPTNMGVIVSLSDNVLDIIDDFGDLVAMSIVVSMIAIDIDEATEVREDLSKAVDRFINGILDILDEEDVKEFMADLAAYLGWSPRWTFKDIVGFLEDRKPDDIY